MHQTFVEFITDPKNLDFVVRTGEGHERLAQAALDLDLKDLKKSSVMTLHAGVTDPFAAYLVRHGLWHAANVGWMGGENSAANKILLNSDFLLARVALGPLQAPQEDAAFVKKESESGGAGGRKIERTVIKNGNVVSCFNRVGMVWKRKKRGGEGKWNGESAPWGRWWRGDHVW